MTQHEKALASLIYAENNQSIVQVILPPACLPLSLSIFWFTFSYVAIYTKKDKIKHNNKNVYKNMCMCVCVYGKCIHYDQFLPFFSYICFCCFFICFLDIWLSEHLTTKRIQRRTLNRKKLEHTHTWKYRMKNFLSVSFFSICLDAVDFPLPCWFVPNILTLWRHTKKIFFLPYIFYDLVLFLYL